MGSVVESLRKSFYARERSLHAFSVAETRTNFGRAVEIARRHDLARSQFWLGGEKSSRHRQLYVHCTIAARDDEELSPDAMVHDEDVEDEPTCSALHVCGWIGGSQACKVADFRLAR